MRNKAKGGLSGSANDAITKNVFAPANTMFLNPLKFFKKFYPVMLTAFTFETSNPSLPVSMEVCDRGCSCNTCSREIREDGKFKNL